MNKTLLLICATAVGLAAPQALRAQTDETSPGKKPQPEQETKVAVQITEIGCMRTLLLLDSNALKLEKLIDQRLTEVDFRVFPSARTVDGHISAEDMRKLGEENKADLVLYATVSPRLKSSMGDFQLYEAEASVQIYSPVSGELMVSETDRETGVRNIDPVEAERSATEKALDIATQNAITKGLEKAHKIIVHVATITGVKDNNQLLIIMNYMEKMEGVYHVRQISFDITTHVAQIEILGSPQSETNWRAYLEKMPREKIIIEKVTVTSNPDVGAPKKYPSWFKGFSN